jgi:glyoxylase-like metal-dependent hydrolase (beta-lactamase superfamily II)
MMSDVKGRFTQYLPGFWAVQSRAMAYNSGILLSEGRAVLIDPGVFPDEIEAIRGFVADQKTVAESIILTHSHWDHILGPERFPGVRVIAQREYLSPEQGIRNKKRAEETLAELERWEEENDIRRGTRFEIPLPEQMFADSLDLKVGEFDILLIHAPGHWPDELVAWQEETGLLWAGDMLSDIEIPFVTHSLVAYEQTLERLAKLDVRVLVPGHGSPTDAMHEVEARIDQDRTYLEELRRAVTGWLGQGGLPGRRREELVRGLTVDARLEANLYAHALNVEAAGRELGGPGQLR